MKLTLINGNKQPYEIDLPKLVILEKFNDVAVEHIRQNTGLIFTPNNHGGMEVQPENTEQITKLFLTYNFKTRYYNNWNYKNTLMLKSDHHHGFDVDTICYNCCKHNHIVTTTLRPHERLMC